MKRSIYSLFCFAVILFVISSCGNNNNTATTTPGDDAVGNPDSLKATELKPAGSKPAWGPSIKDEMQVVIEKLES